MTDRVCLTNQICVDDMVFAEIIEANGWDLGAHGILGLEVSGSPRSYPLGVSPTVCFSVVLFRDPSKWSPKRWTDSSDPIILSIREWLIYSNIGIVSLNEAPKFIADRPFVCTEENSQSNCFLLAIEIRQRKVNATIYYQLLLISKIFWLRLKRKLI